jgi:GT2 family glycosyltransferase
VFGKVVLNGWAVSAAGIDRVEVFLDGQPLGLARYGRLRQEIALHFPTIPDAERGGFTFSWDSTTIPDGDHLLLIQATARNRCFQTVSGTVRVDNATPRKSEYERWMEMFEPRELAEATAHAGTLAYRPLISLIMPVYNTDPNLLERAIQSVRQQAYAQWELCICDDGSTLPEVRRSLATAVEHDSRIKVVHSEQNEGIAAASNQALAVASGEFVALLDHDDELAPHALYQAAKLLNRHPETDLIYSDEDKIDVTGRRYEPFFKPDWSPDLMLSCNYLCHLTVLRAGLVREVGGFQSAYDGSQDYDLFLRVLEKTSAVQHLPKILYHWRAVSTSTAAGPSVKMTAHAAARLALQDHLARQNIAAEVEAGCSLGRWRVKYALPEQPGVSIIIPTGGNIPLLEQCIQGLLEKTGYRPFELVLVDNSRSDAVQGLFARTTQRWAKCRYLDCRNQSFNYSRLNNLAVQATNEPLLLFLNDDTVPINPDWLEAMVEQGQRPEVGAVGAKLLYFDNTIQHAGVVMGIYGNSAHAFKNMPADERNPIYFDLPHVIRNCTVVTAAGLLMRREVFNQVGGFEEIHLPVAFQDVDLCLKVREQGYRIVYTPHARLYHYEAKTKAERIPNPYEIRYMQQKWAHVIAHDPYYNPNLTRLREDYGLALPF